MGKTNSADSEEKKFLLSDISLNIFIETVAKTGILQQFFMLRIFKKKGIDTCVLMVYI